MTRTTIDQAKEHGLRVVRYKDQCEPETEPLGMCAVLWPGEDFWRVPKGWYGNIDHLIDEALKRKRPSLLRRLIDGAKNA